MSIPFAASPPLPFASSSASPVPISPAPRPGLGRLVEATIREDWTAEELRCLAQHPETAQMLRRVISQLWRPEARQLLLHAQGRLRGDEANDVDYHLSVDRSARSRRLLAILLSDAGLTRMAALAPGRLERALQWVTAGESLFDPFPPELARPDFAASRAEQVIPFEDGRGELRLLRQGERISLLVGREAGTKRPQLARVALVDREGRVPWSGYVIVAEAAAGEARQTSAAVELTKPLRAACQPVVRWLRASDAPFESAEQLRRAWRRQRDASPSIWRAWSDWAAAARASRWRGPATPIRAGYDDLDRWLGEVAEFS